MKTEEVIGWICGALLMSALALFAWYLMWDSRAENHLQAVKQSVRRQEAIWDRAGGQLSIRYDDIIASGFPFHTEIRLLRPYLRAQVDGNDLHLYGPYLAFIPKDSDRWQYRIEFLPDFTMKRNGREFYLHLYGTPELLAHAPPDKDIKHVPFHEFGVALPPDMLLGLQTGAINRKIRIEYIPTAEPLTRYIPADIRPALRWLSYLLQQSAGE